MKTADTYGLDNWTIEKEAHAHNSGLPQCGVKWLSQGLFFYQTLVLGDSEVLRNPALRQAAKRYGALKQ